MPNPWDIPPFPMRGDDDQDTTFAGVGRVLTQWEMIEVELAQIYGWLVMRRDQIEISAPIWRAADFWRTDKGPPGGRGCLFSAKPHQEAEGEFCTLIAKVCSFSARRNDVAHSIVRPIQWIIAPKLEGPLQFCAVPPHYTGKKFDPENMPIVHLHVGRISRAR